AAPAAAAGAGGIICIACQSSCWSTGSHSIAGGGATNGATGGMGGIGGGGSGGMSYGIVRVGAGTVTLGDAIMLMHGQPGLGGGTGVNRGSDGVSGDEL
ncbi:MAG TPA: hypothetical protein VGL13_18045, partial [Polyangiaceae bacterium]